MWKYFIAWFPMIILAIANGFVREAWYKPQLGDLLAHQISTGILLLLFTLYFWALFRKWPPNPKPRRGQLASCGL